MPVVFIANVKDHEYMDIPRPYWSCAGHTMSNYVCLHLQYIYYHARHPIFEASSSREFIYWKYLLHTTCHEFGHFAEFDKTAHLQEWYWLDKKICAIIEKLANNWADMQIEKLASVDKRLAQPKRLGAYFDGREAKWRNKCESTGFDSSKLKSYRLFKTGGQFTITDVANLFGEYGNTRLIRCLASDLAYKYTDHAGRILYFFAYGDITEIYRRYEVYDAIHRKPNQKLIEDLFGKGENSLASRIEKRTEEIASSIESPSETQGDKLDISF